MTKTIDYFFSIGSPWAFIGLEPFAALAGEYGVTIRPHVIPLVEENGGIYSRNRPPARRAAPSPVNSARRLRELLDLIHSK